jgi:hypothetical protein
MLETAENNHNKMDSRGIFNVSANPSQSTIPFHRRCGNHSHKIRRTTWFPGGRTESQWLLRRYAEIQIFAESECFEAAADVIYAHPNLGMGLAFAEVSLKSGTILRQWLLKASDAPKQI